MSCATWKAKAAGTVHVLGQRDDVPLLMAAADVVCVPSRQEAFGNVVLEAGWLWRGNSTGTLRTGFHYFNGKSNQFQFFDNFEEQIGGGVWYDF